MRYDLTMPRVVPVVIDSHLAVDGNLLGADLVDLILDELTVINNDKLEAKRLKRHGWWDLPDDFLMADLDGDELVMTRGYALRFKELLREHGLRVEWIDRRTYRRGPAIGKEEFHYRSHQPAAVRAIRRHQQLIYKAPTGSGKTVTVCGAIWEMCPDRSIILVDRINLVDQWIDRIVEHVGLPRAEIGRIGEGKWSEGRITVATIQTLYSKLDDLLERDWFDQWSFAWLDECHHVTAQMFLTVMQQFTARIRGGTSATPDKTGIFDIALNTLGEVAYETTHEELRRLGILVEPEVDVINTDFKFEYWNDHEANKKGHCQKPGCKNREPYHRHRNNYMALKKALITDPDRNRKILDKIAADYQRGQVQLVITDQTTHIDALMEEWRALHGQFIPEEHVHILTGKQKGKARKEIIRYIEITDAPHIIFSTIAGEAMDIAKLSRVHLPFPTSNPRKTEQNVGRGTRMYEGKDDVIIYDYLDRLVALLVGQFRKRRWKCYEPLGFKVNTDDNVKPQRKKGLMSLGSA